MYCFVRKYAAVPVQLKIIILQYIGWCVLIEWSLSSIISAVSASFRWITLAIIIIIIIIIIIDVVVVVM
jgi:hypothetical protein